MTQTKRFLLSVAVSVAAFAGAVVGYPYAKQAWLEQRLRLGDRSAAAALGQIYYFRALRQCNDPATARATLAYGKSILRKQADAGNPEAMYELAFESRDAMCDGVPADLPAFFKWAEAAGTKGYVPAMELLSGYYFSINGDEEKRAIAQAKGVAWMMRSARAGNASSEAAIGHRYLYGFSLPKDPDKAMEWLAKASEQGDASAKRDLGLVHAYGGTDSAIRRKAIPLLIEAADGGNTDAPADLATIYFEGTVAPQNYAEARRWALKATQNHITAQLLLATLYVQGKGGEKDPAEAYAWASVAKAGSNEPLADTIMQVAEKEGGRRAVEEGQAKAEKYAKTVFTIF